jgi:hypothetical protein
MAGRNVEGLHTSWCFIHKISVSYVLLLICGMNYDVFVMESLL